MSVPGPTSAKRAVVSGLGPNGVLATLELLSWGYSVTVVEKRREFTRPIHLHLRSSYLEDVRRLSPELHRRLLAIATPILENSRLDEAGLAPSSSPFQDRRSSPREGVPCAVWSRLSKVPERHVRLNNAETLFCQYLEELAADPATGLTLRRGTTMSLLPCEDEVYRVRFSGAEQELSRPDLVVIAEGGKSPTVRQLNLENVRFSYPKYFMSAHVPIPMGPRTRRVDMELRDLIDECGVPAVKISLWASGHGEPGEGAWIVLEVPESLLHQEPEQAEAYFIKGAMLLMEELVVDLYPAELRARVQSTLQRGSFLTRKGSAIPGLEAAAKKTFAGTFKFEQQCLRHPAAGRNVVVLGDAAGMGHHALSSGLEMGALDLGPLGALCQQIARGEDAAQAVSTYAEAVFGSRLRLLALGMNEYYPHSRAGRLTMLHRAAELSREDTA